MAALSIVLDDDLLVAAAFTPCRCAEVSR